MGSYSLSLSYLCRFSLVPLLGNGLRIKLFRLNKGVRSSLDLGHLRAFCLNLHQLDDVKEEKIWGMI
ncbi:hypothetical protein L484_010060 [Morus notabilis]|uniref:Uncharacterized protein n=1 Tax=Morus notabilis TaxID=981085 RepID=W9S3J1_9ROSA|nr:hypothetical protein L484_010060 [Morus notabilis]